MVLLLKIVVGCLIAIGLAAVLCCAAFWLFIRHISKGFDGPDSESYFAIHLHEDLAPKWIEHKKVKPLIDEFLALGFTAGTPYTVEEMDQIKCYSFFHEQYVGMIYQVDKLGYSFEIVHMRSESEGLTVSTVPFGDTFEPPPGKEKIHLDQVSVAEAFKLISEKSEGKPTFLIKPENFRNMVESYYKEEQVYRNRNGGISFDEFKSIAEKGKKKYSDQHVRQAFIDQKKDELENWNYAGLDEFFESHKIDDDERYSGGCCFIVPHKTDAEAFVHYLSDYDLVLEEHAESVGRSVRDEKDIQVLFERINSSRSPDLRAMERGTISFPVEASVYQLAA